MKVLEYTAKSFYDLLRLRATKHLSRSDSWVKDAFSDKTNDPELYFQKYFALSPDQGEDEILEVLAVNYFSESNCGLVKFWRLENEHVKGNCRLRSYGIEQSLMKAAKIALDKVTMTTADCLQTPHAWGGWGGRRLPYKKGRDARHLA